MPGLLDIAPAAKRVMIPTSEGEAPVDVRGLSAEDFISLIVRFPAIAEMLMKVGGFNVDAIIKAGPPVLGAIIAAACGDLNGEGAEKVARQLALATQVEILRHAVKLTMPRGPGPFVEELKELLKAAGVDLKDLSAISSPPPSKPSSTKGTTLNSETP